ncbi:6-bladed beta-propeller, partial [bacterium]|nr:6-bladed beta-propeller [bacterium]
MENLSFVALLSTILIVGCREPDVAEPTPIDWGSRVTTDQIEEVLQIDTILPISPNGCFIANYDKTMMDGKMVYVLDKMQNAIFSIDTEECQVRKLIDKRGSAQNEYVGISDFSLGHDGTLWVFDSDSRKVNVYGDDGT